MSEKKTNKPERFEPVTLDDLKSLIIRGQEENRAQNEQLILKVEQIYTANGGTKTTVKTTVKKPVTTKKDKEAEQKAAAEPPKPKATASKKYSDTHYWFVGEYLKDEYKHTYTAAEYEQAAAAVDAVKEKSASFNRDKAIGNSMWGAFLKTKKNGQLKTMFCAWRTNLLKIEARIIAEENATGDDDDDDDDGVDPYIAAGIARPGPNDVFVDDEEVDPDA